MKFAVGSLIRARGREWVVLPESDDELLIVRPLGGADEEVAGVLLDNEDVESASFQSPDPRRVGDFRSARLLRDAIRLGFRSSAGPFRSFGRIAVEPRPYQLVPLLMSLKMDPIRVLIADDVGIGKTIEASLIAKELLDRGEVRRLAVLCPPHLADQWETELREKFNIAAERVLPSTATRLERRCAVGQSLFDVHPFVIVSTDFIKSDRRRDEFQRTCPELVILDEAHTCAFGAEKGGRHQRYKLVSGLAEDPSRHLILVTATPHSGKEEAFRSLLGLLDKEFSDLPSDLSGAQNAQQRRVLARHLVQRRRADIRHFLDADTPFPERHETDETFNLSPAYKKLFEQALEYARESVSRSPESAPTHRVRWWSALALLRSLASSPAAAVSTLRTRAAVSQADPAAIDEIGRKSVFDVDLEDSEEGLDVSPGALLEDAEEDPQRRRLLSMARTAESLFGDGDSKLLKMVSIVDELLREGFSPIIFCRFIPTATYLAEELRKRLSTEADVVAVTGMLPSEERERRVNELAESFTRVLVCTDCLSEGINLQESFDAVIHYDLSWNPTRHEQREGRVDRYGQPASEVRVLTYYGVDNQIDGVVLDVLLKKHKQIRKSTGISVPVPAASDSVVEAILEGLLLRESASAQERLPGLEEYLRPKKDHLYLEWESATERERRSRTMFAQPSIRPEEVARELDATREAIGTAQDAESFIRSSVTALGGVVSERDDYLLVDLKEVALPVRQAVSDSVIRASFHQPVDDGISYVSRTHPLVEALATHVIDTALDEFEEAVASRSGVIRTRSVEQRTTLILVRLRFLMSESSNVFTPLLTEECLTIAFEGSPAGAQWLPGDVGDRLMQLEPDANVNPDQAQAFVERVLEQLPQLLPGIREAAERRGQELLDSHLRVRSASAAKKSYSVRVQEPDIIGVYIYLPAA